MTTFMFLRSAELKISSFRHLRWTRSRSYCLSGSAVVVPFAVSLDSFDQYPAECF